jgi:hypothetical protein
MIEHNVTEIVHTFATWKAHGRIVRKGEKAIFAVPIWNHAAKTDDNGNVTKSFYYLKTAHFFAESQTDAIADTSRRV